MTGTASTIRPFLLVEVPGPWGVDALRGSRLPDHVKHHLERTAREWGVRPLVIRRHGRTAEARRRVFAAYAHPSHPWLETMLLDRLDDVVHVDLAALGEGRSPGLEPHDQPLFLVCTHGRHDSCCAELGRPLAGALTRSHPDHTWEVSHIGGDRFAGNVLVLPEGLYYGRVAAEQAPGLAERHLAGQIDVAHLRGRSGYRVAVQAAELYLRQKLTITAIGALTLRTTRADDEVSETVFDVGGASWRVRVRTTDQPAVRLTCRALRPSEAPQHELVDISPVAR